MRTKLMTAALAVLICGPMASAFAQDYDRDHHDGSYQQDHVYRGDDHEYRHRCDGGNGAVGTVAGGVGGAVLGNAIGGGVLGTVAGGVGGALLGRHLDKENTKDKHGC